MGRIVDKRVAQGALNRAARNAKYGSPDVRAGRLVSPESGSASHKERATLEKQLEEGRRIAQRLRVEARWVQWTWASWEALNGKADDNRKEFREALTHLGLGEQAGLLQELLVRETLLALFRMSDQRGDDRLTLCAISGLLQDDNVRTRLAAKERLIDEGCAEWLADFEAGKQPERIAVIRDFVPPRWSDLAPNKPALHELRQKLKGVRDKLLAHSLDGAGVTLPIVNEMQQFLQITIKLVRNSELIFLGSAQTGDDQLQVHLDGASRFFDLLEEGPIGAYKRDMELRSRLGVE